LIKEKDVLFMSGYNILVVDDEVSTRDLISALLMSKGHRCDTASDGIEALKKISQTAYDAVITDIVMPNLDGLSLTREISKRSQDLPVMVITGFVDERTSLEVLDAGAMDFITKPFSTEELAVRVEKMMRDNEILMQSVRDPLTKIFNRRKFNDELSKELKRSERYNRTLSIIMFDIDDFKKVNDEYGHQVGDNVLIEMSSIVSERLRKTDIFARYGGEEFIILMPETDIVRAAEVAEHLRQSIGSHKIAGVPYSITCSFGVTEYGHGESDKDIISRADFALYGAKNKGKNRVEALKSDLSNFAF
jgi:diguanylate cyclase (GGDEF)-like protein